MNRKPYTAYDPNVIRRVDAKQPVIGIENRASDVKLLEETGNPTSVRFYTVDSTIMKYLENKINPIVTQDGNAVKIPVVYGNSERWKGVQKNGVIRDKFNKIQLPIIMIRRTGIERGKNSSPVNKYLTHSFKTGWNRYNPYDKFNALNGITPSREYYNVIVPDYYDFTYDLYIWTEYVEQMNKVIEQITVELDEFWGEKNGYKFRVTANEFNMQSETPAEGERMVRTKATLKAYAYLLPEKMLDKNGMPTPVSKISYTPKKIVTFTEIVDNID